jgi:hypothetical protein
MYSWISLQRKNFAKGTLSKEQIVSLEKIQGWIWGREDKWNRRFERLKKGESNSFIRDWISTQRELYKKGRLPKDKLDKLISVLGIRFLQPNS